MAQEKTMQEKLLNTIKAVVAKPENEWFANELRKAMGVTSANFVLKDNEKIVQIYEYCIEEIIRKQAEEFYKDFPLKRCVPSLIEDFVRMESFKRKDNFGDFCLALYQQIECINNTLCESKKLSEITEKMWGCSAYVKYQKGEDVLIENRADIEFSIASLVFIGKDKETGLPNSIKKCRIALQNQYAMDKIRIIVYFLGYQAKMKGSEYDAYVEITTLLQDIYNCRNMNHRGSTPTEWEKQARNRILPLKSLYYYKFIGAFAQYIEFVKSGIKHLDDIERYSKTINPKKVEIEGPKVLGKIDLPQHDTRKRFK